MDEVSRGVELKIEKRILGGGTARMMRVGRVCTESPTICV